MVEAAHQESRSKMASLALLVIAQKQNAGK